MAADTLARNWWLFAIRGVLAILFGVLALLWPAITLVVLVLMFGAYVIADGVLAIASGLRNRKSEPRWWTLVLEGLAGIALGVVTFLWPETTAVVLVYLIAAWAVVTGVLETVEAIRLRKEIRGEGWLALGGILSVVFGLLLVLFPGAGAISVVWLIGAYAIVFGIVVIVLAFRLRRWRATREDAMAQPA
ncbi:MAG TPA: HdeD family acid-resistance protein [Anaerolineales bacterium]|nr:HdeD family acid-resistance protein [Anaerolineales bacterium]